MSYQRNSHWPGDSHNIVGIASLFVNMVITVRIVIISLSSKQFSTICVKSTCQVMLSKAAEIARCVILGEKNFKA